MPWMGLLEAGSPLCVRLGCSGGDRKSRILPHAPLFVAHCRDFFGCDGPLRKVAFVGDQQARQGIPAGQPRFAVQIVFPFEDLLRASRAVTPPKHALRVARCAKGHVWDPAVMGGEGEDARDRYKGGREVQRGGGTEEGGLLPLVDRAKRTGAIQQAVGIGGGGIAAPETSIGE